MAVFAGDCFAAEGGDAVDSAYERIKAAVRLRGFEFGGDKARDPTTDSLVHGAHLSILERGNSRHSG